MDSLSKKLKRRGRRRQSIIIGDLEKSSSEPDLTDFSSNPLFTSNRWRKFDHETITVDELKFYRRRKPPGALNDLHTRSNICLYDTDEPIIPYSNLKTEYETVFCDNNNNNKKFNNTSKSDLLRRDTTLNLNNGGQPMERSFNKSEQQSQYQPFDEEEILKNRSAIIKQRSENFALNNSDVLNQDEIIADYHNINSINLLSTAAAAAASSSNPNPNNHHSNNNNDYEMNKNDSQMCHLKLEGEINYLPEYRSQFINKFAQIERAHSIPQISSIKFQGNFVGMPEYRDSFKSYEQIAKSAPIKKPDNICVGNGNGNGYGIDISSGNCYPGAVDDADDDDDDDDGNRTADRYNKNIINNNDNAIAGECRTKSLKTDDHLHVNGMTNDFLNDSTVLPEYNESFKNPNITCMPERAKPRIGYLKLHGNIEYAPEYRCSYLDFPRARPITNKPISNFKLSNNPIIDRTTTTQNNINPKNPNISSESSAGIAAAGAGAAVLVRSRRPRRRSSQEQFEPNPVLRNMIYHDSTQMTTNTNDNDNNDQLSFFCQPEVRKAKKELMIKERSPSPQPLHYTQIQPTEIKNEIIKSGNLSRKNSLKTSQSRNTSPTTYKLMVENVDNPRGTFKTKKQTPKFGRRSSITSNHYTGIGGGGANVGDGDNAHKLRNRTKIIEGNSNYISQKIVNGNLNNEKNLPSFIVLNEPCKQNAWMKPSWYS